ncbi:MAG: hypothetical protein GEV11_24775 [Streptosporangiales bacterium]|nr:hypothetical protein [Streptosporangiales bacterium]
MSWQECPRSPYDTRNWRRYERPLSQDAPHRSGPKHHDGKYFAYTGNTTYGRGGAGWGRRVTRW